MSPANCSCWHNLETARAPAEDRTTTPSRRSRISCTLFSSGNFSHSQAPKTGCASLSPKEQGKPQRPHRTASSGYLLTLSRTHHHLTSGSFEGTCADLLSRLLPPPHKGEESVKATHNQGALRRRKPRRKARSPSDREQDQGEPRTSAEPAAAEPTAGGQPVSQQASSNTTQRVDEELIDDCGAS